MTTKQEPSSLEWTFDDDSSDLDGESSEATVEVGGESYKVTSPSDVEAIIRAERKIQVEQAVANRRTLSQFRNAVRTMACVSTRVAAKCTYALPRGGKSITGPGIRFAEILAACYGNISYGSRVIEGHDGPSLDPRSGTTVTGMGDAVDLESNVAVKVTVTRSILDKHGRRFTEDMVAMTGDNAAARARRNAIFSVIPRALWLDVYEDEVVPASTGKGTIPEKWDTIGKYLYGKHKLDEATVLAALGLESKEDLTVQTIAVAAAWGRALGGKSPDGRVTPDDIRGAAASFLERRTGGVKVRASVDANAKLTEAAEKAGKKD